MASVDDSDGAVANADDAWGDSMRQVLREVIEKLPDEATLGDLVDAARKNSYMAPVLEIFSVQELINLVRERPRPTPGENGDNNGNGKGRGKILYDEDGNPVLDLGSDDGPSVIRRRADVPDGDILVLRTLSEKGPQREGELSNRASLSSDQIRLILRGLRSRGLCHIEGSGAKRRIKITRAGNSLLRKHTRDQAGAK